MVDILQRAGVIESSGLTAALIRDYLMPSPEQVKERMEFVLFEMRAAVPLAPEFASECPFAKFGCPTRPCIYFALYDSRLRSKRWSSKQTVWFR
jgi:hypothetical protein